MCLHNPNAAAASYPLNKVSQNWMTALYFGGAACNLPLSGYKTNVNALSSRDCAAAYLHPRKKNTTHAHMRLGSHLKRAHRDPGFVEWQLYELHMMSAKNYTMIRAWLFSSSL